jgi:hypothetical protein
MVLPRGWFDAAKSAAGIQALRNYRREWNENAQTWRSQPVHEVARISARTKQHVADAGLHLAAFGQVSSGTYL